MIPGRSSGKGSSFERQTCVQLSLWVSRGRKKDLFWRTAMSGGRATVHRKKGSKVRQCGDICSVSPEGHPFTDKFLIECKHIKDLNISQFIFKNTGKLMSFWMKALDEADYFEKIPFVVAKQNMFPTLLITPIGVQPKPIVTATGSLCYEMGLFETFLNTPPTPDLTVGFPPILRKRLGDDS